MNCLLLKHVFSDGLSVWPGRTVRQMNTASEFLVSSFANVNLSISLKNIYNGYNLFFGNLGRTNYNVKHSLFFLEIWSLIQTIL